MDDLPIGPLQPAAPPTASNVVTYVPMDYQEGVGEVLNVSRIFGIFRRHAFLISAITLLTVGAAIFVMSRQKPMYKASALIRLSYGTDLDMVLKPEGGGGSDVDPGASELMVLRSQGVIGEAVDREGLRLFSVSTAEPASFVEDVRVDLPPEKTAELRIDFGDDGIEVSSEGERVRAAYGAPVELNGVRFVAPSRRSSSENLIVHPLVATAGYVSTYLGTEFVPGTNGIYVTFTSGDPLVASRVVNAVVEVHQESNVVNSREEATRRREFLENQLRETDSLLAIAQLELSNLRTRSGVYSAESKFVAEQGNLMQVELQREQLRSSRRMLESVLNTLEQSHDTGSASNMSALMSTPGVSGNPLIGQLFNQIVQLQTQREAATTGPWSRAATHPDVVKYDALIAQAERRLIDAMRSQLASIDLQIGALGGMSARATSAMSELPETQVQETRLVDQVDIMRAMGQQVRSAYQEARMEEAVESGNVEIVHLATGATRVPSATLMTLMMGLVVGLVMGSAAAMLREKMDQAIHDTDEMVRILQVPSLALIPRIGSATRRNVFRKLLPGSNGKHRNGKKNGKRKEGSIIPLETESYLTLRTNLLFSPSVEKLKTLVVTSAAPQEGKTVTATNLAAALAQQGLRILLVDCDLRRPSLAKAFGSTGDQDLTSVLLGEGSIWEAIRPSGIEGLDLLPTLSSPPNPSELLGGQTMGALLEQASERYYMVILDSPPLLLAADAAVLGAQANAVLLVIRAGSTERDAAEQALQQLQAVGARVIGAVLNDPDSSVRHYGGRYRYQYYSYSGASDA